MGSMCSSLCDSCQTKTGVYTIKIGKLSMSLCNDCVDELSLQVQACRPAVPEPESSIFNKHQIEVGSPLRTLKGTRVGRSMYGVGKYLRYTIYVHKQYAKMISFPVSYRIFEDKLHQMYPKFSFNLIKFNFNEPDMMTFINSVDFDSASEPHVGDFITISLDDRSTVSHSDRIYHHKWLWVLNDYEGFDVASSWNWSKYWLSRVPETAKSTTETWLKQLSKYIPV